MKFSSSCLFFSLLLHLPLIAQDVAFCGMDGEVDNEIAFVLLRDFSANEVLYFTEDEYSDMNNSFFSSEGHIAYTIPAGGLANNTVVTITESSDQVFTVGGGGGSAVIVGTGDWEFSNADELYAYSASNASSPWNNITEVHCYLSTAAAAPPVDQLIAGDWPNSITIAFNIGGSGGVNGNFNDAARVNTTLADLLDGANWTTSTGAVTLSTTNFTNQMIALPVEWLRFTGKTEAGGVDLQWSTSAETNNAYFKVEHSTDGRGFKPLGTVNGNGTIQHTSHYQYQHLQPAQGANYYRVEQVDFDGASAMSDVIVVNVQKEAIIATISPNPFQEQVRLDWSSITTDDQGTVIVDILDLLGKQVHTVQVNTANMQAKIDLSMLNSGTYFLCFRDKKLGIATSRIVKL